MEKYKSASNTELTSRAKLFLSIYSAQGFHRTGTKVDLESGTWFQKQFRIMFLKMCFKINFELCLKKCF